MASNEYKLTVVDGTELTLSVNAGLRGPSGPAGADALWNYTGEYSGGVAYAIGDIATYDGELWYRTDSNGGNVGDTPSDVSPFWDLLAAKGEDGGGGSGTITTSTSTNLTGFISGNGTNISGATAGSVNTTGDTIALRDADGRLQSTMIRLKAADDTHYTQINASNSTESVSFQFPLESATIATNKTAVMLAGEQLNISGNKSFSGQIQLVGQSITNSSSALTSGIADLRYPIFYKNFRANALSVNTTALVDITSVFLPIGTYRIEAHMHAEAFGGTSVNSTFRLAGVNEAPLASQFWGFGSSSFYQLGGTGSSPVTRYVASTPIVIQSFSNYTVFATMFNFICRVDADDTIKLQARQTNTSTNSFTIQPYSYIIATKIN
jgi:hypothetical protein